MKLEVGVEYRTRDGRRVAWVDFNNKDGWIGIVDGETISRRFNSDGSHLFGEKALDIVGVFVVVGGNKYKRTVPSLEIDIYDVIKAWDVRCPERQHALKKIMCAGESGAKGVVQDLDEAIQALQRAKELVG